MANLGFSLASGRPTRCRRGGTGIGLVRLGFTVLATLCSLSACISPPPAPMFHATPQYRPATAITESLRRRTAKLSVGDFKAAPDVQNQALQLRGSTLGGADGGTFATYLRDSLVTELRTAARYDDGGSLRISGVLTHNELNAGIRAGSTVIGAEFTMTRDGKVCFEKSLVAIHDWQSSNVASVAIPAAIDNYPTGVQKLLETLFSDPDFIEATNANLAGF